MNGWTDDHELTAPWVLRFMREWDEAPGWERALLASCLTVLVFTLLSH